MSRLREKLKSRRYAEEWNSKEEEDEDKTAYRSNCSSTTSTRRSSSGIVSDIYENLNRTSSLSSMASSFLSKDSYKYTDLDEEDDSGSRSNRDRDSPSDNTNKFGYRSTHSNQSDSNYTRDRTRHSTDDTKPKSSNQKPSTNHSSNFESRNYFDDKYFSRDRGRNKDTHTSDDWEDMVDDIKNKYGFDTKRTRSRRFEDDGKWKSKDSFDFKKYFKDDSKRDSFINDLREDIHDELKYRRKPGDKIDKILEDVMADIDERYGTRFKSRTFSNENNMETDTDERYETFSSKTKSKSYSKFDDDEPLNLCMSDLRAKAERIKREALHRMENERTYKERATVINNDSSKRSQISKLITDFKSKHSDVFYPETQEKETKSEHIFYAAKSDRTKSKTDNCSNPCPSETISKDFEQLRVWSPTVSIPDNKRQKPKSFSDRETPSPPRKSPHIMPDDCVLNYNITERTPGCNQTQTDSSQLKETKETPNVKQMLPDSSQLNPLNFQCQFYPFPVQITFPDDKMAPPNLVFLTNPNQLIYQKSDFIQTKTEPESATAQPTAKIFKFKPIKTVETPNPHSSKKPSDKFQPTSNFKCKGLGGYANRATTSVNDINICKFKLIRGTQPSLEKKKSIYMSMPKVHRTTARKQTKPITLLPAKTEPITQPQSPQLTHPKLFKIHLESQDGIKDWMSQQTPALKRKTKKTVEKDKLEATFKNQGFLIKTQQVASAEGSVYCKFRQLNKFTRYLFKSWKDYLPKNIEGSQQPQLNEIQQSPSTGLLETLRPVPYNIISSKSAPAFLITSDSESQQ